MKYTCAECGEKIIDDLYSVKRCKICQDLIANECQYDHLKKHFENGDLQEEIYLDVEVIAR